MEQTAQPKKLHYAWWILISCCCLYAGSFALINSILGVYMVPVTTALGFARAEFSLMMTTQTVSIVIMMPVLGTLFANKKVNINLFMTICAVLMISCPLICSFASSIWMFYLAGFLSGFGVAACFSLAAPILIGNWFISKHRGKMLGIASGFTGISTIAWAPMFTMLIASQGWRTTYLINAVLIAVLILPWTLFVIKRNPEDKGLKPFGYDENAVDIKDNSSNVGMPAKKAFMTPAFWLVFFGVALVAIGGGFISNQPAIAKELLANTPDAANSAIIGASMISAAALGNLLSKIGFGFVADRLKLGITFLMFLLVWVAAYILWIVAGSSAGVLIAGGFCIGFSNAPSRVGWPLTIRKVFGNVDYAKLWSTVVIASSITGGFSTAAIALFYDVTGSYQNALYIGVVLVALIAVFAFVASSFVGKMKWEEVEKK